jgi:hypothetical protein
MYSMAGQTLGRTAGQPLELLTSAPNTKKGASSTISANRPSSRAIRGMGCSFDCPHALNETSAKPMVANPPVVLLINY